MVWVLIAAYLVLPAIFTYTWLVFHFLPSRFVKKRGKVGRDATIERLRWLTRFPSITGASEKRYVYWMLGDQLVLARRYDEALEPLRTALGSSRHRTAPSIHGRLADALEGLGRISEAEDERSHAVQAADKLGNELTVAMARGKEAERQGRLLEAVGYFEEVVHQANTAAFERLYRLKVANLYSKLGDPEQTIFWAEQGINDPNEPDDRRCLYRRLAGYACINLCWYDDAETYLKTAYDDAVRIANQAYAEDALSGLIFLRHCLGKLEEAVALAGNSWPSTGLQSRAAKLALSQCLTDLGRFDQARAGIHEALGVEPYSIPRIERRSRNIQFLALALLEIAEGNVEAAIPIVEDLLDEGSSSPKMDLFIQSVWSYLLAETMRVKEAVDFMDRLDAELSTKPSSPSTLRDCYLYLARASISGGHYARAIRYCELRLALPPHPVGMPTTYYLLGEAHAGNGDSAQAEAAYRQGLSYGIETTWTAKIRKRLQAE